VIAVRAGRSDLAIRHIVAALPSQLDALDYLREFGQTLAFLGRLDEAAQCYEAALQVAPDHPETLIKLGNVRLRQDRLEAAESSYRAALRLRPDSADAFANLGTVLFRLTRLDESEACYRAAVRLRPDGSEARENLGRTLLLAGKLAEGWEEHEWRLQTASPARQPRGFPQPQWSGEPLGERVLLLHAEQGFGDTIQFCRYVPLAAKLGRVVLEAPPPLLRLLAGLPGVERVVAQGDALPAFDLHCPLLSLPRAFRTTLETIPAEIPYLAGAPDRVSFWRQRLAALEGIRVGLAWAGRPTQGADRRRSISLERLAPLAGLSGLSFVSLQTGDAAAQTRSPPPGLVIQDWTNELHDFAETAALVEVLDLVIAVDTAVLHLAAAVGRPVWLLNRFDTCWRWLLERDDSPWYPKLRQFRQARPGDWDGVLGQVAAALARLPGANPRA
jgi:Flp pilus assembly protein TadD